MKTTMRIVVRSAVNKTTGEAFKAASVILVGGGPSGTSAELGSFWGAEELGLADGVYAASPDQLLYREFVDKEQKTRKGFSLLEGELTKV